MRRKYLVLLFLFTLTSVATAWGYDYNGDGTSEIGIFRPRTGLWAIRGTTRLFFGQGGDQPAPGDYNDDGITEAGIFRPPAGLWAGAGTIRSYLGKTGDESVSGDYTGDGRSEIAIFRPQSGLWVIRGVSRFFYGGPGDIPVPADYSGNGRLDPAVFRRTTGVWAVRGQTRIYFGASGDRPLPCDYRGGGRADPAIFRKNSGLWAVRGLTRWYFGRSTDLPVPADYTGDGTVGIGVFRPESGLWALRGLPRSYFGAAGDLPVSSRLVCSAPSLPPLGIEVKREVFTADYLSWAVAAGSKITRFGWIDWRKVQPVPGNPPDYNWNLYDRPLAAAAEHGLTVVAIVGGVPGWAGEKICGPIDTAALPAFADFLYAAVRRYSQPPYNVKHWELFNEPDGTRDIYWAAISCWGRHGDRYAEMLAYAYPAIKAADPEAQVLFGALALDNCIDDNQPAEWKEFDCSFLNDVLASGGGSYFDYLNFHYYYFAREKWGSIKGKTAYLRNLLAEYGLSKPIVCSETGISGYDHPNDLELQARFVPVVYARGLAVGLEAIVWFPLDSARGQGFEGGLIWDDLTPKPAYYAYQTMTSQLSGYRYIGPVALSGIEGYSFQSVSGGRTRQVLWTNFETTNAFRDMDFSAQKLRVVSKFGEAVNILDGGTGDLDKKINGRIRIRIGPSPIYVETN